MVVIVDVIFGLSFAPGEIVSFEFHAFADGEGRNADTAEAEVIGAVVMTRFWVGIGANGEIIFFRELLDGGIESGALGTTDFHFFGNANWAESVVVQIEDGLDG